MCQDDKPEIEEIENADAVSRLIERPGMVNDDGWHWHVIFPFPSKDDRIELVVWRKRKPLESDVHMLGVARQNAKRARGKPSDYLGFVTALVGPIRAARTKRGFSFSITHAPTEGDWHAHIQLVGPQGATINSEDLWDARSELQCIFGELVPAA